MVDYRRDTGNVRMDVIMNKRYWINTHCSKNNTDPEWNRVRKEIKKRFDTQIDDNEDLIIKEYMTEDEAKETLIELREIYNKNGLNHISDMISAIAQPFCPKCEINVRFSDYYCDCGTEIIHDDPI